ncbi:MAG: FAD-dependent oxidoreductase [Kiritimatiellae bacterium]|nr:FAD-dependent oxidoreductase [Kiritimatiellia bacterium]
MNTTEMNTSAIVKSGRESGTLHEFDLIVAGGGPAGCGAALAAARRGLSVLLIEESGSLGGAATKCLVTPFMPWMTKISESGEEKTLELSAGIFAELNAAIREDAIYGEEAQPRAINEESLKVILDRKMDEAGVKVLFHATLCGVAKEGRRIAAVSVATVAGVLEFSAATFVDATGDAALSAMAGVAFRLGRPKDLLCQPMTLCFRMCNVDTEAAWRAHDEINALYKRFREEGQILNPRENVLKFPSRIPGVMHFNTTRIVKLDPTDPFALSKAEALAREQVVELVHFLKENFAAFRNASLMMTAAAIGVRESRMIEARHILTADELMAGTHFEDGIAAANYDIDIHSPDGSGTSHWYFPPGLYYTIPYRSLLPREFDNLIVAGRCIGATHEAQASVRIMPTCICMGEAAGTAAALARDCRVAAADVDAGELRARLRAAGAFVG